MTLAFLLLSAEPGSNDVLAAGITKAVHRTVAEPTACQVKTLSVINARFRTNLSSVNILPTSEPSIRQTRGQVNTNFAVVSGLTPVQFNAISTGRYAPRGLLGFVTGYGRSLHVTGGPTGLDPTALSFRNANVGGNYSVQFTAHLDTAWAHHPFGALLHWLIDVRRHGAHRPPC